MVKQAFWKMSELITGNVNLTAWKRLLNCYVFFVLKHGIESWTLDKSMPKSIMAFEYWCYRQMLKISWRDKVKITEVLSRMVVTEPQLYKNISRLTSSSAIAERPRCRVG